MPSDVLVQIQQLGPVFLTAFILALFAIVFLNGKIRGLESVIASLRKALEYEKLRGRCPYLTLERDTEEYKLMLTNDSYCYAKNVQVHDAPMIVDVGFQKRLTLKFDPIQMIKPHSSARLHYKAFDGDLDVTNNDPGKLIHYFPNSGLELTVTCQNMEGDPFREVIINEKDKFIVREVKPATAQS